MDGRGAWGGEERGQMDGAGSGSQARQRSIQRSMCRDAQSRPTRTPSGSAHAFHQPALAACQRQTRCRVSTEPHAPAKDACKLLSFSHQRRRTPKPRRPPAINQQPQPYSQSIAARVVAHRRGLGLSYAGPRCGLAARHDCYFCLCPPFGSITKRRAPATGDSSIVWRGAALPSTAARLPARAPQPRSPSPVPGRPVA